MKVYIASRFTNKDAVVALSNRLREAGMEPTQTWTDATASDTQLSTAQRIAIARQEIEEIRQADALILLTENCERVPGGMHFEFGLAFALGKVCYVLGPAVHIFCDLVELCEAEYELLEMLRQEEKFRRGEGS